MSQKNGSFCGSFQAVLFISADSSRKKGFQLVESPYFCMGQQKKENRLKRTSKMNRYLGTCKPATIVPKIETK